MEYKDLPLLSQLLAPSVELHGPLSAQPTRGHAAVTSELQSILDVLIDVQVTDELITPHPQNTPSQALIFTAQVRSIAIDGLQLIRFEDTGQVSDLTIMIRSLPAALIFSGAVAQRTPEVSPSVGPSG